MTLAQELLHEYTLIDPIGARKINKLNLDTHEPIENIKEYQREYHKQWRINKRARDKEYSRNKRAKNA